MLSLTWLLGTLSLLPLVAGMHLVWNAFRGRRGPGPRMSHLGVGLVLLGWSFGGGRWLTLRAFRPGGDEARPPQPVDTLRLERPDGAALHVELHGPQGGPCLLLTHGAGTDRTVWRYVVRALADRFRVIVWDRRGLGRSSRPHAPDYTLETQAHDLRAVLDAAVPAGRRAVVVGHSLGGMVLLTFCRLFPELLGRRVAGLGLVDTSARNPYHLSEPGPVVALQPTLLRLTVRFAPLVWLLDWLIYLNGVGQATARVLGFGGAQNRAQVDMAAHYMPGNSPEVRARESLAMFGYDETPNLDAISVPVLVVTGDRDRMVVPAAGHRLADELPSASLVTLEPAGHMSVVGQHAHFTQALERFAAKVLDARARTDQAAAPHG